jgi:anti-sigma factor RsiW/cytoskeletal protein CcmA (bactofilin family)
MTTCPSALTRSMHADGELSAADAEALEVHLRTCDSCRARIAALRGERAALRDVLAEVEAVSIPRFERPLAARDALLAVAALVGIGWVATAFWSALAAAVPSGLHWLSPIDSGSLWDLTVSFVVYLARGGIVMSSSIVQYAAAAASVALLASVCAAVFKQRAGTAVLLSVLALVVALPQIGSALEVRRSEGLTTLRAGETVDDTLFAVGDTVEIEGDVNGDLFAFGRRVAVRGKVTGNVISAAETVDIQGTVEGSVFSAARAVALTQRVQRNLYAGARDVTIAEGADVARDMIAAGGSINVNGRVGHDLTTGGGDVFLRGSVGRNVLVSAANVTLADGASVGGNLEARVAEADDLQIAPGAAVTGTVNREIVERKGRAERANRYLTTGFYIGQLLRLAMGFVTGLLLLWIFPGLQTLSLASAAAALRAAGIGLLTAVALPVLAVIACVTVIGIPLGIIVGILWLLGLYFAKTVVAQYIGRSLFNSPRGTPHYAATLLAGLVIVLIAVNLPWIGGLVGLVLTLVGLGMIVAYVYDRNREKFA